MMPEQKCKICGQQATCGIEVNVMAKGAKRYDWYCHTHFYYPTGLKGDAQ